jgi:DUF1365 family protein
MYEGTVWHRRAQPEHRFHQHVSMAWLDLDHVGDLPAAPLLSTRAWSPARVRLDDFSGAPDVPLADQVRTRVERELGERPAGTVHLLANLRTWGFCFNPLAVYWCCDAQGAPVAQVLQVTNTPWHERHVYVIDRRGARADDTSIRFAKAMHVSPFMPMDCTYELADAPPGPDLRMRLSLWRDDRRVFDSGISARRVALDASSVLRALVRHPTQRVSIGIHVHAARLLRKGAVFHPHPARRPTDEAAA